MYHEPGCYLAYIYRNASGLWHGHLKAENFSVIKHIEAAPTATLAAKSITVLVDELRQHVAQLARAWNVVGARKSAEPDEVTQAVFAILHRVANNDCADAMDVAREIVATVRAMAVSPVVDRKAAHAVVLQALLDCMDDQDPTPTASAITSAVMNLDRMARRAELAEKASCVIDAILDLIEPRASNKDRVSVMEEGT